MLFATQCLYAIAYKIPTCNDLCLQTFVVSAGFIEYDPRAAMFSFRPCFD